MNSKATPFLRVYTGPTKDTIHRLSMGHHVIGRDLDVSVHIDDPDISRRHAQIEVTDDGILVGDLESKNGVFYKEKKLDTPTLLRDGEVFSLGRVHFEVHHPGSQVAKALARAGEVTMTTTSTTESQIRGHMPAAAMAATKDPQLNIRLPLISTIVFALIIIMLSIWS